MSKTFAARLNRLFDTVYPPGRGQHTSAEVIAALKAEGITMSAPYLSQLRSGNRTNPSSATMAALANFFRIKSVVLHRRRVLREARQGAVVAGRHARRGRAAHCRTHRRVVGRSPGRPGRPRRGTAPQGAARQLAWPGVSPDLRSPRVANFGLRRRPSGGAGDVAGYADAGGRTVDACRLSDRYCRAISRIHSRSE